VRLARRHRRPVRNSSVRFRPGLRERVPGPGYQGSQTVPLFREFIFGGGPWRDISADFALAFTKSRTTARVAGLIADAVKSAVASKPPTFPTGTQDVTLKISDVLDQGTLSLISGDIGFTAHVGGPVGAVDSEEE